LNVRIILVVGLLALCITALPASADYAKAFAAGGYGLGGFSGFDFGLPGWGWSLPLNGWGWAIPSLF
jgi:hypothetical protein